MSWHIYEDSAADVLSRLPVGHAQDKNSVETRLCVQCGDWSKPAALTPKQMETVSAEDPTLQLVRQAVMTGDWSKLPGTSYKAVKD